MLHRKSGGHGFDAADLSRRGGYWRVWNGLATVAPLFGWQGPDLAASGMTAFEDGAVESCRSLGMDPADLFRAVSLVEIRPE
jgi:ABC-type arginine transport system permease subunit